jgi:hypothetical protein
VGLERGPFSLVSATEELRLRSRKSRIRPRDPSRCLRGTFYPQTLALSSPTSCGRSVGIVRSRTQATEFSFSLVSYIISRKVTFFPNRYELHQAPSQYFILAYNKKPRKINNVLSKIKVRTVECTENTSALCADFYAFHVNYAYKLMLCLLIRWPEISSLLQNLKYLLFTYFNN